MKDAFKLYFKFIPKWTFVLTFLIGMIDSFCLVYLSVIIPTSVTQYFSKEISIATLVFRILVIVVYNIVKSVSLNLLNLFVLGKYDLKYTYGINQLLFEKMHSVDLSYYDKSVFFEKYRLASENAESSSGAIVHWFDMMVRFVVSITTTTLIISLIDAKMLLVMIFSIIINGIVEVIITIKSIKIEEKSVSIINLFDYIERVYSLKEYQTELRTTQINNVMTSSFEFNIKRLKSLFKKLLKLFPLQSFGLCINNVVVYFILLGYACYSISVLGVFSVSNLVALLTGAMTLYNLIIKAFSNVFNLFEHKKKFAYYQEFMSLDCSTKSNKKAVPTNIKSIVFSDVCFAYDKDEIIKDFSLEINAGTSLAIIGPNGAGKSTVIKLLLGYYSVTKGKILLNNENINNYDKCDYSQLFSFVGQSAELFEMSIAENILLKKCETDLEKEQVYEVLQQVGMLDKILSLENNIYTVLGKEFTDEGVLFSGGEMQKLCIARALAQKNKVLIVDEPSSHIDPIAENEIFSLLDKIKEDKIVIFVTHNIKKAAKADNIVWLEEGKIIEQGKHEEMLNYNGKYFSSYNSSYQILMEN